MAGSRPRLRAKNASHAAPKGFANCGRQVRNQWGSVNGLATLTPARPDCNGNGPVPAYFFSVLQSGFLAHACSMPACLHRNFEGNLKENFVWTEKRVGAGEKQVKMWVVQKSSFKLPSNYWHHTRSMPANFFAVSNLVPSSRSQAGVIWLQSNQSIKK